MIKHLLLLCILFATVANAQVTNLQRAWSTWIGAPWAVTLRNGYPQDVYTLDPYSGLGLPWFNSYQYSGGQSAAYSDSITGAIKFIAGFRSVYNRNFDTVTNGWGLLACGSVTPMIIPDPGGQNKYYILHEVEYQPSSGGLQTNCSVYGGITGAGAGLRYSVLDGDFNNGLGRLTLKNEPLPLGGGGQFAQIRHANGRDLWVVGHVGSSTWFGKTLVHPGGLTGVNTGHVPFPTEPANAPFTTWGGIDASPDGSRIATVANDSRLVNLYAFNNSTAEMALQRSLRLPDFGAQVCFSPDGSKLYVSTYNYGGICANTEYRLYQFDLAAADPQATLYEIAREGSAGYNFRMRRVPGNRILVQAKVLYSTVGNNRMQYGMLAWPNQPGAASSYRPDAFVSDAGGIMLPVVPNDVVRQSPEAPATRFNMPADTAVCFGSFTLTAPAGHAEYRWSNGASGQSITVTEPGLYSVRAGPALFDKPAAYGYTNVRAKALPMNLGADTLLCPKSTYTLTLPAGFTDILWQDGDTSRQHVVTQYGGLQVVTATDANGCRTRDTVCVRMKYQPRAEFGPDTTLCGVPRYLLRMEPMQFFTYGGNYLWSTGATTDSLRITEPGTYWGRVTYDGCTVSDTVTVNFTDRITLSSRDTALCSNDSLRLEALPAGRRYRWSTGDTTQFIIVRGPGFYGVETLDGPCRATAGITVTAKPSPQFSLGPDQAICPGTTAYIYAAHVSSSLVWNTGSTAPILQPSVPGIYWVEATAANGCKARDTIVVTHKPEPLVHLGADTLLCSGGPLLLDVTNPGATYQWSTGNSTPAYLVIAPDTYWVRVSLNGCDKRDTIVVRTGAAPVPFTLGADTVLCPGTSLLLAPPQQDGQYRWQDGSAGRSYTVTAPGRYALEVRNACGAASDDVLISPGLCELLMPTAFTPDGDGVNDVFRIRYPQFLRSFRLTVFDRFGSKVYETATPGTGWDGTFQGRPLRPETYIWRIDYVDKWGIAGSRSGQVLLVR
ncbi:gliding motility-associated C-terminal domain-containing protein [Flaviaesturariibacter amylovorans]|uniref:T9SS type B sorting domain-containing protein n=1 Tax=Flaviaesturariibacter amylovorans TaxID=1084520 RepID=A0ABP8G732_9BACT